MISSQKVGKGAALCQICPKRLIVMQWKNNTSAGGNLAIGFVKGEIPYYVDNLFYESFGMSSEEFFEALKKNDFLE